LNQPVFLFKSIIFLFIFSIPTIQVLDQPEKTSSNRAKQEKTEPNWLNRFQFGFEKKKLNLLTSFDKNQTRK
jgi:hypothetical protein